MAFDLNERCISLTSAADLSANQFQLVKLDGSGDVVLVDGEADLAIGVLTNEPLSGESARVCVGGVTRIRVDSAGITVGQRIGNGAASNAQIDEATGAGVISYGTALATGAQDEIVSCLVNFESATVLHA